MYFQFQLFFIFIRTENTFLFTWLNDFHFYNLSLDRLFSLSFGQGFDKILQVVSGTIIGIAAGLTHVWAPTIAVLLLIRKANKDQFVGLTGLYIFVGSLGLFSTHYFFDLLDSQTFIISTLMIIPSIFGFLIGEKIRSFISEKLFETLLLIFSYYFFY